MEGFPGSREQDSAAATGCVEQVLARTFTSGDVVVLDNLSAHEVPGIREAVEAEGANDLRNSDLLQAK